jgi:signal transduction histidine kinase
MTIKILVVDDEPDLPLLISQIFKQEIGQKGYEFSFAGDGLEALNKLQADPEIELLLTDINMPRMDGLTLLARLVEIKHGLSPVLTSIIFSAYDDMVLIRKAMNQGAFDFLTKPLDIQDMRATLQKTVQHIERLKRASQQEEQARQIQRRLHEALEQRVKERTAELEAANAALRASNSELDAFARTVAHDLKGPLSAIIGYNDLLIRTGLELEFQERLEIYQSLKRSSQKAVVIIDELLLLAGTRQKVVELSPLMMDGIVGQVLERLGPAIIAQSAKIALPNQWPTAMGYAPWIEQVWTNYISNGLKYGGQPPCLDLGATLQADSMICFWVRDNGAGLTKGEQAALFVEFSRLNQDQAEGHGLGLAIVRRIIERLGGTVGVNSEPGQGSLFYFTLPQD